MLRAEDDEILFVFGRSEDAAEKASFLFPVILDIGDSPRSPDLVCCHILKISVFSVLPISTTAYEFTEANILSVGLPGLR